MKKSLTAALLALSMLFAFASMAGAEAYTPPLTDIQYYKGNDKDLPISKNLIAIKFDSGETGTKTVNGITVTMKLSDDGKSVTWTSSKSVRYVFVKGGPAGNLYVYSSSTGTPRSGTDLVAPDNRGGNRPDVSHVTFYFCSCSTK